MLDLGKGLAPCLTSGPSIWGLADSQSPSSEQALPWDLVAGLGPKGGPLSTLVEAPGLLPFGPEDTLRPDQRNHSAGTLGTGEGLPNLPPPLFLRLITHTTHTMSAQNSASKSFWTFFLMS